MSMSRYVYFHLQTFLRCLFLHTFNLITQKERLHSQHACACWKCGGVRREEKVETIDRTRRQAKSTTSKWKKFQSLVVDFLVSASGAVNHIFGDKQFTRETSFLSHRDRNLSRRDKTMKISGIATRRQAVHTRGWLFGDKTLSRRGDVTSFLVSRLNQA